MLKTPIKWNVEDEFLVHTVFLLFTPEKQPNLHIKALQAISVFCKQPDYHQELQDIVEQRLMADIPPEETQ